MTPPATTPLPDAGEIQDSLNAAWAMRIEPFITRPHRRKPTTVGGRPGTSACHRRDRLYPIGLGSKVDVARLKELAELTGGDAFFASQVSDLPRHYLRIVEAMRRSYVVGYTSTNPARDGSWRKVEIRSLLTGVHVRSRGGYFAPPQ